MRFGAPIYLWVLLVIPFLAVLLGFAAWRRHRALVRFADPGLARRLASSLSVERRVIKGALLVVAAAALVLALARPQWGARTETVTRRGVDVVVAVDTSLSMLTEDVKPNRLARARSAILSLMDEMQGDRIGLVAFSGTAYVACPLTLDYAAAGMFVDVLDPTLLPVPGTAIAAALKAAVGAFPQEERRHKVVILITDGEDHEGDVKGAAEAAAEAGVVVYTVGVGSPNGDPIPIRDEQGRVVGYKEDKQRLKVTSRLDEGTLEAIASATHGKYYRATSEGAELKKIYQDIAGMDRKTLSSRLEIAFEERYPLPLGAALLLLAIEAMLGERRGRQAARVALQRREAAA